MKNLLIALAVCLLALLACVACGGADKNPPREAADLQATEQQHSRLAEALGAGQLAVASQMADSMSLFVDDLTPDQTVQVLMAFLTIHNDAVANGQSRRDLETLRKYVDVYDIALSVNPSDTRAAFARARKVNPAVDLDSIAASFREKLTQYDAIHDGSLTAEPEEKPDTTAADTTDEIPMELRPAE